MIFTFIREGKLMAHCYLVFSTELEIHMHQNKMERQIQLIKTQLCISQCTLYFNYLDFLIKYIGGIRINFSCHWREVLLMFYHYQVVLKQVVKTKPWRKVCPRLVTFFSLWLKWLFSLGHENLIWELIHNSRI